jgi:hypothetical protein
MSRKNPHALTLMEAMLESERHMYYPAWPHSPSRYTGPAKKERQCVLPGCEEMTGHNGGYCCAEHCKQHREMQKKGV